MLQWKPQKLPWVMVTHSTGRSERSSWRAWNSGWTSAQNSCSHSLSTIGSGKSGLPAASGRGTGCRASAAVGGRSPGSRASSSNRMVVPERAGPVTITGAVTGRSVISGAASMAAVSSRRARSERSSSLLGDEPADEVHGRGVDGGGEGFEAFLPAGVAEVAGGQAAEAGHGGVEQVAGVDGDEVAGVAADGAGHEVDAPHPVGPDEPLGHGRELRGCTHIGAHVGRQRSRTGYRANQGCEEAPGDDDRDSS